MKNSQNVLLKLIRSDTDHIYYMLLFTIAIAFVKSCDNFEDNGHVIYFNCITSLNSLIIFAAVVSYFLEIRSTSPLGQPSNFHVLSYNILHVARISGGH